MRRMRLFSAALVTAHVFAFHGMGQPSKPETIRSTAPVTATLPNGRLISPAGDWIGVAPFPFSLALRPDCQQLVAPSLGFPFALNLIDHPANSDRRVAQIPRGFLSKPEVEVYTGVAYSPDGKLLYVSTGDSGAVEIVATKDWHKIARIDLNGRLGGHNYKESFAAALVLSTTGSKLYVIDEANWRIVVIDTAGRTKLASMATGVNPIALCLSPDNERLYIANSGLFEYKTIPGADNADRLHTGLHFPPFGYPSPPTWAFPTSFAPRNLSATSASVCTQAKPRP